MKTTNFNLSKKLAEIGFKAKNNLTWAVYETRIELVQYIVCGYERVIERFPSYDLEALLDALPKALVFNEGLSTIYQGKLKIFFDVGGKNYIGYQSFEGFHPEFTLEQSDESLADCAAKLLIELFEAGIKL